jgi:hypothetical protein
MPRPRPLPSDDQLLDAEAARTLIIVSKSRWDGYWKRYPALVRGCRIVQVNPQGKGVRRFLRSAVIEHIHNELARERWPGARLDRVKDSGLADALWIAAAVARTDGGPR